jgi:hypothetical protein
MLTNIGIWIDHKEAVLVFLKNGHTTLERINSNAERNFRQSGGWKSGKNPGVQSIYKEQKAEERRKHQYQKFYRRIIKKINKADTVYIFGPGNAKQELTKEIQKLKGEQPAISAVQSCHKLTDNQLKAKVRSYFDLEKV